MTPNNRINPALDCDSIRELIPDYAFGLADPEDIRFVESNLINCPEAVNELADFRQLQAELRASVLQIEPSLVVGERLMAAIATPTIAMKPRRQSFRLAWLAAALVVIALVMTNIYWLVRVNDLTRQQNELVATITGAQNNAFVLTQTNDLRWVRLPPSEQNADASAFLMWNAESEIGLLYAHGFPKLEVGKIYQLWLTRGTEAVSAGTLQLDDKGQGALLFHISEPIDKYTWARITAEPNIGSNTPSGTIVVVGKLQT